MTVKLGKLCALLAVLSLAHAFLWAAVTLMLRSGYRPALMGWGALWALPALVLGFVLLEGISVLRTLPSPFIGSVTSAQPPWALRTAREAVTVSRRPREDTAVMIARLSGLTPRVAAHGGVPLPGHVCEVCFDAPAHALAPAPWGGEMGVCATCLEVPPAGA